MEGRGHAGPGSGASRKRGRGEDDGDEFEHLDPHGGGGADGEGGYDLRHQSSPALGDGGRAEDGGGANARNMSISVFLRCTYDLVNNPEYADLVSWSDDGERLVVHKVRAV